MARHAKGRAALLHVLLVLLLLLLLRRPRRSLRTTTRNGENPKKTKENTWKIMKTHEKTSKSGRNLENHVANIRPHPATTRAFEVAPSPSNFRLFEPVFASRCPAFSCPPHLDLHLFPSLAALVHLTPLLSRPSEQANMAESAPFWRVAGTSHLRKEESTWSQYKSLHEMSQEWLKTS